MIIGVDGNEANIEKRVGVSVYTYELLRYFSEKSSVNLQFIVYLRDSSRSDMPDEAKYFRYKTVSRPFFLRDVFLPISLYTSKKPEVFFSPAHYTPRFCPSPVVVTIHDVAYEYYPDEFLKKDLYKLKNWTKHAVKQAQKIIAVSQNTKKDIVKFYKVPEDKIEVIYNGYRSRSEIKKTDSGVASAPQSDVILASDPKINRERVQNLKELNNSKYILYVGTLQPRKNLTILIEAFSLFTKEMPGYKLVITGKKGWLYDEIFEKVIDLKLKDQVIFRDYVSNSELINLYQYASVFVLPSLYEGFGIPILEAMSYNCPVLASNASSLPEIGGSACLYFDPHDTIDLMNKMRQIIEDRKLREEMIQKARTRVKRFSWEKCGEETLKILTNM